MRVGFICSSEGSALFTAITLFKASGRDVEPIIVTDRNCGAQLNGTKQGFRTMLIPFESKLQFSSDCVDYFHAQGVADVLMFFTRLVGNPLIEKLRVCNVHPALLPAFKGIGAVGMARKAGALLLGASLHKVDAYMDSGELKYQVVTANLNKMSEARANKVSYLQKVWLTLNWLEECDGFNSEGAMSLPMPAAVSLATRKLSAQTLAQYREFETKEMRSLGEED